MISRREFVTGAVATMALASGGVMTACGGGSDAASTTTAAEGATAAAKEHPEVKIGIRADMVDQLASVKDEIEMLGYTIKESVFDDSVQPDVALGEKSIDINWYQHEPYMQAYNKENGTDFVMVQPKTFYPLFAMYSSKWKSIDELPEGATIGLCNDATNQSRGLNLLVSKGLITIKSGVDVPTMYDVDKNEKNLQFIEAEMSVLPQSIDDVDAICLAAGHMVNAGKSADGYIAQSDDTDKYAVGFVVRAEDKDAEWPVEIAKVVQCPDLAEYFKTQKQGTQIPTWE